MQHAVMQRAQLAHSAGCVGVICSGQEAAQIKNKFGKDFLAVTPGIRPAWTLTKKEDQRRITTPAQAISAGADYLVIGRPIRDAEAPGQVAARIAAEIEKRSGKKVKLGRLNWQADSYHIYGKDIETARSMLFDRLEEMPFENRIFNFHDDFIQEMYQGAEAMVRKKIEDYDESH